jgi:hypothetical protein
MMCKVGKKMGMINSESPGKEKTYICSSCDSKSSGSAGNCCGAERQEEGGATNTKGE